MLDECWCLDPAMWAEGLVGQEGSLEKEGLWVKAQHSLLITSGIFSAEIIQWNLTSHYVGLSHRVSFSPFLGLELLSQIALAKALETLWG